MSPDTRSHAGASWNPDPGSAEFRFGAFEVDVARRELRRDGVAVAIKPKPFDLLACLLERHDRVVTRDELCRVVWEGVVPTEAALTNVVYEARAALGDDAHQQRFIRTFRGKGLRFVAALDDTPTAATGEKIEADGASSPVPFVGRTQIMARLARSRDAVLRTGRGRVVLLEGEAGIGKTSVVQRLVQESPTLRVLTGRCPQRSGAPPFWPWIQIVRRLRDQIGPAAPASLTPDQVRLLDRLTTGVLVGSTDDAAAGMSTTSTAEAFRLFDAVAQLLRVAAAEAPVAVVLEDVHWADRGSLLLLEFLGIEVGDVPIVLLVTFRGEENGNGDQLAAILGELVRHAHCERLLLDGLARHEVRALLAAILRVDPEPELVETVVRRTDGNPFFVKEIAALVESAPGTPAAQRLIPPAVQEAIERRLSHLSDDTRTGLSIAAVIGRELRLEVLDLVWTDRARAVLSWLDEAREARLVVPVPDARGAYRFAHALIQETIYEGLGTTRRSELHRRIADALEFLSPRELGPHATEIAHHAFEAAVTGNDPGAAIEHCVRAGDWATSMLAHDEAVEHYQRAVRLLDRRGSAEDRRTEGRVLLALGEAQRRAGDDLGARQTFERATAAAQSLDDAEMLARAAIGYGGPLFGGGMAMERDRQLRTAQLLEDANAALGDVRTPLRARVLAWLARALDDRGDRDALSGRALEMARDLGDATLIADVLGARREALWGPENAEARRRLTAEMIALADRRADRELALKGRMWRVIDLLELGEIDAVVREIEPCAMLAEQLRQLRYIHGVAVLRVTVATLEGRFDDAERLANAALVYERRLNAGHGAPTSYFAQLTVMRREQGRLDELLPLMEASVVMYPMAASTVALAYVYFELGRLDDVRPMFDGVAVDDFTHIPRDRLWLTTMTLLAQLCAALGDRRHAPVLYDLLLPLAEHNVVNPDGLGCYGTPAFQLGLLATVLERWDDAERHFAVALGMFERLRATAYMAQGRTGYARMLIARDAPGDREKAEVVIEEALATANALDMRTLRRRLLEMRTALRCETDEGSADCT